MSDEGLQDQTPAERIDADAVCLECNAVNPEGTLICKSCGNNLRDQRARRLTSDEGMAAPGFGPEEGSWLGKGLVVLGILVILWTALNLGKIDDVLITIQATDYANVETYWTGSESRVFDSLQEELARNPVTESESRAAIEQPVDHNTYEGRYVLVRNTPGRVRLVLGEANVRQEGDRLLFVAVLSRGTVELRGELRFEGETRLAARDSAGVKTQDSYYGAEGFAQKLEEGGFECFGYSDFDGESYSALAYRVP